MKLSRPPKPSLRPFVDLIWASTPEATLAPPPGRKELVLPTGATHIVLRLEDAPLRLYTDLDDDLGENVGTSLIGGTRASPYVKHVSNPVPTVGAMLRPGAIELLLQVPAIEIAGRHSRIDDLWPQSLLSNMLDQLRETPRLADRLNLLEDILFSRLPHVHAVHPLVAHALGQFDASARVGDVVTETGFSRRHFTRTFTEWVGLSPKTYCRVRRFGRVLKRMNSIPGSDLADLAAAEGYADQAHMTREFRAFSWLTPTQYMNVAPADRHHMPI
jgi:AraC-like DNA-binding protein